jgi:hypothetical protein
MSLQLVKPSDVDLSAVDVEWAHVRGRRVTYEAGGRSTTVDRRAALAKPPFADSAKLWARAVELFMIARGRGEAKGEPFIVVTNIYRQIGGGFR